jgi:hypothetical protein
MRIPALGALLLLAACAPASATALDASNPAHCIAAFNLTAIVASRTGDENLRMQSIARAIFESETLETREAILAAKAESQKVSQDRLIKDLDAGGKLAIKCAERQDSDPIFEARLPGLLVRAREWEPSA